MSEEVLKARSDVKKTARDEEGSGGGGGDGGPGGQEAENPERQARFEEIAARHAQGLLDLERELDAYDEAM